jgi:hypothetical protein
MTVPDEVLESFHRVLVEEIRTKRPEYLKGPFTVAEIYQDLVPYPTHRDRIGVEMNGDYEDALIRMLAGEGGYLALESEHALRELRSELQTSNPNTGVYREFAAVDVRLNPERIGGNGSPLPAPSPGGSAAATGPSADALAVGTAVGSSTEVESDETGRSCRWCRAPLPVREDLNFCPYCGTDVHSVPCSGCGNELEPEWRFCISCGTERPS